MTHEQNVALCPENGSFWISLSPARFAPFFDFCFVAFLLLLLSLSLVWLRPLVASWARIFWMCDSTTVDLHNVRVNRFRRLSSLVLLLVLTQPLSCGCSRARPSVNERFGMKATRRLVPPSSFHRSPASFISVLPSSSRLSSGLGRQARIGGWRAICAFRPASHSCISVPDRSVARFSAAAVLPVPPSNHHDGNDDNNDGTMPGPYTPYEYWVRRLYRTNMFNPVKLGLDNMQRLHDALGNPMDDVSQKTTMSIKQGW